MNLSLNHGESGPGKSFQTNARQLRVCYFGTYRAEYSRNRTMIEGLRRNGVSVAECHAKLWQGIEDRVQVASGGWLRFGFVRRVAGAYWRLLRTYRQVGDYEVMVLGYPGQLDVLLARILTWIRRKPLVLDIFMSIYLIAEERGLTARHFLTGRLIHWVEKVALLLPDLLIQDTPEYVRWLQEVYGLDEARFRLVPTGADDRLFHPVSLEEQGDGVFRVLYYGTFIPNHGVECIIQAATMLADQRDIHLELIGEGPTKPQAMALAKKHDLKNVSFVDWVDMHELPSRAAKANVFLGAFGTTPQSLMTVQNKIYEGLAMARPVLSGDSPTMRQQFEHGTDVFLVERGNPQALAEAILTLRDNPALRDRLAEHGHLRFANQFAINRIGEYARRHLEELVPSAKGKQQQTVAQNRESNLGEYPQH